MAPQIQKPVICDFQLTPGCSERKGLTDAKWGYLTMVGKEVKFACEECATEIVGRIANDLEGKIRARGDGVA